MISNQTEQQIGQLLNTTVVFLDIKLKSEPSKWQLINQLVKNEIQIGDFRPNWATNWTIVEHISSWNSNVGQANDNESINRR